MKCCAMDGLWKVEMEKVTLFKAMEQQNGVRDGCADPCVRCRTAEAMLGQSPALSWVSHS